MFVILQERVLGTLNCKTISQGHIGIYSGGGDGDGDDDVIQTFLQNSFKLSISYDSCKYAIKRFPHFDGHCQTCKIDYFR